MIERSIYYRYLESIFVRSFVYNMFISALILLFLTIKFRTVSFRFALILIDNRTNFCLFISQFVYMLYYIKKKTTKKSRINSKMKTSDDEGKIITPEKSGINLLFVD